ncbi:hypothetical protein [Dactylosporangium darangshiense]|uniref:hypothetical protein n=1 Tax=Dactylosporangium darangshiense TaxID=579108 RepID=UPI0031E52365
MLHGSERGLVHLPALRDGKRHDSLVDLAVLRAGERRLVDLVALRDGERRLVDLVALRGRERRLVDLVALRYGKRCGPFVDLAMPACVRPAVAFLDHPRPPAASACGIAPHVDPVELADLDMARPGFVMWATLSRT